MDIKNSEHIFFLQRNMVKKNGFDSYSKSAQDIINYYNLKYEEIDKRMKAHSKLTMQNWQQIITFVCQKNFDIEKLKLAPFEIYITAFILAFHTQYENAINTFRRCQRSLPNTIYGKINSVFISLQIAQLLERMGDCKSALSVLIRTRMAIQQDQRLFTHIHNFYASCNISIGLLCFRYKKRANIAQFNFLSSILTRNKYKTSYQTDVYKHYIAQANRYIGMMPSMSTGDAYIYMKTAYNLRVELLQTYSDDISREEMFHLETDFIIFLIRNRYKNDLVCKHARALLHLIATLSPKLRNNLQVHIGNIARTLHKFYTIYLFEEKAKQWMNVITYINLQP